MGDTADLASISRWGAKKGHNAGVDDSLASARGVIADWSAAAGARCAKYLLASNHDERVSKHLWSRVSEIAHLYDDPLPKALGLDAAGVTYVRSPYGGHDYPWSALQLPGTAPSLTCVHGWMVRKQAGQSAMAHVDTLGRSVACGHCHRLGIAYRTFIRPDGLLTVQTGIESGTMSKIAGGLGYSAAPNWMNGWATVWVHPDGLWTPSLALYVNGTLTWEGSVRRAQEQHMDMQADLLRAA